MASSFLAAVVILAAYVALVCDAIKSPVIQEKLRSLLRRF